ncbi:MAG: radical SAM protein [Chromatiaceae bacterium]|nr:radical SAM protein [Chromatiaceae bacterium]
MIGNSFSLVLLSTNQCNAACDYCFEDKTAERLSLEHLRRILDKLMDYMDANQIDALSIHWQGGEAMLLPPQWYQQAFKLIRNAAETRGKRVDHGLQTNMLAYSSKWNPVIAEMFGNSISTSLDYPNLHRRVPGRDPESYTAIWERKVRMARAAGIDVKVISVVNQGTLEIGAERFWDYFVDELGVFDFQINTPFPGGETNEVKQGMTLDIEELARFHCELADIWLERGHGDDVRIGPFDELLNYFTHRDAFLPCIWGQNCADELVAIDARGNVAQCDCWVTSYPDFRFGNILECDSLTELLDKSEARRHFYERPIKLVQGDCIRCDYLALCHGGCPVRAYSVNRTLFEKDPYCHLYKTLFRHLENRAAQQLMGAR